MLSFCNFVNQIPFSSQFQPLGSAHLRLLRGPERETPHGCGERAGLRGGRLKNKTNSSVRLHPTNQQYKKNTKQSHRDIKPAAVAVLCEHVEPPPQHRWFETVQRFVEPICLRL